MILERRAYTLRPGLAQEFWDLQLKWQTLEAIPGYLERNLAYFHAVAGKAEQIVHLQRYDDFADWRARVAANQKPGRAEYYSTARKLLSAQENSFYSPSPNARLSPLWNADRDWTPGEPPFAAASAHPGLIVVEEATDLLPGQVPAYWAAVESFVSGPDFRGDNLIGTFFTLVGQLHRILEYRWFASLEEANAYRHELNQTASWKSAREAIQPLATANATTVLKPSPVPWMRALFDRQA